MDDSRAQQCLLPPQREVQHAGWDRIRLQHVSVGAHLSTLRSEIMALTRTSMKMIIIAGGIENPESRIDAALKYPLPSGIKEMKERSKIKDTSTIEVIASPQISRRRRRATSGISTIFWKGSS